jgi:UDP-N-acetylmuramate dehydrogenase
LKKTDKNDILKTISKELERRKKSQPIGTKNAGCIFKNPENDSAGRLIDSLNLKNYNIGGIEISDIHANFFINKNNGCADDMIKLIKFVKNEVYKKYNIKLETEIKIINDEYKK